jgi:hypothetical protein
MQKYRGVEKYLHAFLTLALVTGKWLASRPWSIHLEVRNEILVDKKLDWLQSRSGRFGREKNLSPLPGIEVRSFGQYYSRETIRSSFSQ